MIHYNHGSLVKTRQKLLGKPEFKKTAVHCFTILKRCKNLISHFCGNDPAPFLSSAADPPEHRLTPQCIPVLPIQVYKVYGKFSAERALLVLETALYPALSLLSTRMASTKFGVSASSMRSV